MVRVSAAVRVREIEIENQQFPFPDQLLLVSLYGGLDTGMEAVSRASAVGERGIQVSSSRTGPARRRCCRGRQKDPPMLAHSIRSLSGQQK